MERGERRGGDREVGEGGGKGRWGRKVEREVGEEGEGREVGKGGKGREEGEWCRHMLCVDHLQR